MLSNAGAHHARPSAATRNWVSSSAMLVARAVGARGQAIAKADAVVVQPELERHAPLERALFLEIDRQLAIMVAHPALLAPRLLPRLVMVARALPDDREVAQHLRLVGEQEAELRFADHRLAVAVDAILDAALAVEADRRGQHLVRATTRHIAPAPAAGGGEDEQDGGKPTDQHRRYILKREEGDDRRVGPAAAGDDACRRSGRRSRGAVGQVEHAHQPFAVDARARTPRSGPTRRSSSSIVPSRSASDAAAQRDHPPRPVKHRLLVGDLRRDIVREVARIDRQPRRGAAEAAVGIAGPRQRRARAVAAQRLRPVGDRLGIAAAPRTGHAPAAGPAPRPGRG